MSKVRAGWSRFEGISAEEWTYIPQIGGSEDGRCRFDTLTRLIPDRHGSLPFLYRTMLDYTRPNFLFRRRLQHGLLIRVGTIVRNAGDPFGEL